MKFYSSTAPGTNSGLAVKLGEGESPLDGWRGRLQPQEGSVEARIEVLARRVARGEVHTSYMPLNADPSLLPERSRAYLKGGTVSAAAAATPQLGAAISRGYGRAPTAFVYTSADTLLSTTTYQSTAAAAAVASARQNRRGPGSAQAFAFCCDSGSSRGRGGSASAPASPASTRTLLYTRAAAGTGPDQRQHSAAPAVDLLDRLTLLRRLAPATGPAPRPPRLAASIQTFTAAPAPTASWGGPAAATASSASRTTGVGGTRRWCWDDSVLDASSASTTQDGAGAARPITAVPAPGWLYCGDVVAVEPAAAAALDAGPGITAVCTACCSAGGKEDMALAAVATADGRQASMQAQRQLSMPGNEGVRLVVRSPRPHHLHMEEDAAQPEGAAEAVASQDGGSRAAFRPPGPLKHRFGNKPALRPHPEPSPEERTRAAGLRGCGCPRSPRQADGQARSGWQDRRRTRGSSSGRQSRCWAGEEEEGEAVAVLTRRPRSAAVEELRHCSLAADAAAALSRPSSACLGLVAQQGGRCASSRRAAAAGTCTAIVGSPAGTTGVAVTARGDVVVASSPRTGSAALGSEQEGQEDVVVVATSPRGDGAGGSDVVVVCREHAASPRPARKQLAEAAAAVAGRQSGAAHTKLMVSVPADAGGSFRIRADASGTAAAAPAPRPPSSSGPSSPIKAWRPQPAPASPGPAAVAHAASGPAVSITVSAVAGRPAPPPPAQQARMAELERLEGEMRRREKSFSDLLGELDRISAKCARLTASTAVGRAAPAGSSSTGTSRRQPQQGSGGLQVGSSCTDRHGKPSAQEHTTQCFGSLVAALASSGLPAAAAWADQAPGSGSDGSPGRGGQGDDGDWGWENLLAFEQQIREQQRKLVEQGVLPAEYA